jgi:probable HAF family extracellular repeat protein
MGTNCYVFSKNKNRQQKKWKTLISLPLVSTLYSNIALSEEDELKSLGTLGGPTSSASGVSADGSVVVGLAQNENGYEKAFRWTAKDKMQDLGTLGGSESSANWVSADGSVMAGNALSSEKNLRAFRWTASDKMQDLGTLGGLESRASGINADGSVVVGLARNESGYEKAFRWTVKDKMQDLGTLGGLSSYEVSAVSADGTVVVGTTRNKNGHERAFRWTAGDNIMQDLGTMGAKTSWAKGANADGSVVVGYVSTVDGTNRAFRWTASDKMRDLGTLGGSTSSASGVSADGNVVVGMASNVEGKTTACRWTVSDNLIQDLGTFGGSESSASLISADGNVVVGTARNENGYERAFQWTDRDKMKDLDPNGILGSSASIAKGISADGNIVVGMAFNEKAEKRAFIWKKNQHFIAKNHLAGAIGLAATATEIMLDVANTRASLAKMISQQWRLLALNDARLAGLLDKRCHPITNTWCINGGTSGRKGSYRQDISASLSMARQWVPGWYVGAGIDQRLDGSVLQNIRTTTSVPALAVYTGWDQHPDKTGWHVAAGVGYVRDETEVVRDYYEKTERGKGHTQLSGKAFRFRVSNVFQVSPTLQITPYEEIRYTASDRKHYYETGTAFNTYYNEMKSSSYKFHSGINITAQFNEQFATSIGGGVDVDLLSEKHGGEARAEYLGIVSVPIHSLGRIKTFGELMVTYNFLQGMKLSLIADVHNKGINKQNREATLSISKIW